MTYGVISVSVRRTVITGESMAPSIQPARPDTFSELWKRHTKFHVFLSHSPERLGAPLRVLPDFRGHDDSPLQPRAV